jgi:hypothetical protein
MKRLRACVLAVALGLAVPSIAAPAVAQEASSAATLAEREALVRRFFVAIQFDKMMNVMMESMLGHILADSGVPEDKREVVREAALEAYAAVIPQMTEANVDLYAQAFTLDELQQLVAFYESPVGRSLMTKTVMLSQQSGAMMERFQPIMERELMTRLCARIDCSATATGAANK